MSKAIPSPTKVAKFASVEKLAYTVEEAAFALGLSERTVWTMIKEGDLKSFPMRGRTLIRREELLGAINRAMAA